MTMLPIIPPGTWTHFLANGTWPNGIQKELTETATCPWAEEMAQWVTGLVALHDGSVYPLRVKGRFPRGWYRHPVPPTPSLPDPPQPRPTDPIRTLERWRETPPARTIGTPTLDPMGLTIPPQPSPVEQETGCQIVPVPNVDVLIPYPLNTGYMPWPGADGRPRPRRTTCGEFGRIVVRIPGSDHPMFSTGNGIWFICREYLSTLGRMNFAAWDQARRTNAPIGDELAFNQGREICYVHGLFDGVGGVSDTIDVLYQWYTRDFAVSHMQCPRNFFADNETSRAAGVALQMHPRRWRYGGERAAAYLGDSFDDCQEQAVYYNSPQGPRLSPDWVPIYAPTFDASGNPHAADAPESPMGYRQRWRGRYLEGLNLWRGPAPGAFL